MAEITPVTAKMLCNWSPTSSDASSDASSDERQEDEFSIRCDGCGTVCESGNCAYGVRLEFGRWEHTCESNCDGTWCGNCYREADFTLYRREEKLSWSPSRCPCNCGKTKEDFVNVLWFLRDQEERWEEEEAAGWP